VVIPCNQRFHRTAGFAVRTVKRQSDRRLPAAVAAFETGALHSP